MKFTEQGARQSFLELLRIPSVTATAGEEQACAYLEGILDRFGIAGSAGTPSGPTCWLSSQRSAPQRIL